jgi:predicted Zn-dependent protease
MFFYFVSTQAKESHLQIKGDHYINLAKDALQREDYGEFAKYIGTGASLARSNLDGQKLFADLLFAFGRTTDAFTILEDSLSKAKKDREYFRGYLRRSFSLEQDRRIIACAEKYMDDAEVDPGIQADLRFSFAQANFLRGNFDIATDFLRKRHLDITPEGYTLLCQISWERGDRKNAIEKLAEAVRTFPSSDNLRAMLARWYKESGDLAAAKDSLNMLLVRDPTATSPRIQMLYLLPGDAQKDRRDAIINDILKDFSKNEAALLELGQFANETSDYKLTDRLYKHAAESGFPSRPQFLLTHVETLTNAGKTKEAISIVDELFLRNAKDQWFGEMRVTFDALRMIAYYTEGQADIGAINLKKVLDARTIQPQLICAIGKKLVQVRRFEEANTTMTLGHQRFENNQAILLQFVKMKVENEEMADELESYLRKLMSMRRPPQELLQKAYTRIASDKFLYSEGRETLLKEIKSSIKQGAETEVGS